MHADRVAHFIAVGHRVRLLLVRIEHDRQVLLVAKRVDHQLAAAQAAAVERARGEVRGEVGIAAAARRAAGAGFEEPGFEDHEAVIDGGDQVFGSVDAVGVGRG